MTLTVIARNQPTWVCESCGRKYGRWWYENKEYAGPENAIATYHVGDACGVCKRKDVPVTEARDFGYLIEGWQPRLLVED